MSEPNKVVEIKKCPFRNLEKCDRECAMFAEFTTFEGCGFVAMLARVDWIQQIVH